MNASDDFGFLNGPPDVAARRLLGCWLIREFPAGVGRPVERLVGRIVETEAYDQTDAASHSYKGQTPRTAVMFGPPGHLYVYFTYGMHYCCNVVTGPNGHGAAVLIRAVEPLEGVEVMVENRLGRSQNKRIAKGGGVQPINRLTNGPAKLCQAFAIDKALNGHDLGTSPLQIGLQPAVPARAIVQTTRIGITQAKAVPWRFYIAGNQFVSKSVRNEAVTL